MTSGPAVVAYCRVSTYEQKRRGYGIEIQTRDVTLFAERQRLFVRRFYKDEGESGVKEKRTALPRLLRDCRANRVRRVMIPSPDRLSRDVRLAENLFHDFEHLGGPGSHRRHTDVQRGRPQGRPHPPDPGGDRRGEPEGHYRAALEEPPGARPSRSSPLGACRARLSASRQELDPETG
jgi:hypothetical protein